MRRSWNRQAFSDHVRLWCLISLERRFGLGFELAMQSVRDDYLAFDLNVVVGPCALWMNLSFPDRFARDFARKMASESRS